MCRCTRNILKSAIVELSIGVRHGAPPSLLFLIYIDKMIKKMKEGIGIDDFLGTLYALLLMDDTIMQFTAICVRECLKCY